MRAAICCWAGRAAISYGGRAMISLTIGAGSDTLNGGTGADAFLFTADGRNEHHSWTLISPQDRLDLSGLGDLFTR